MILNKSGPAIKDSEEPNGVIIVDEIRWLLGNNVRRSKNVTVSFNNKIRKRTTTRPSNVND
jgi:hypothetical protein